MKLTFYSFAIVAFTFITPSLVIGQTLSISKPYNNETGVTAPSLKVTASPVSGATRYTIQLSLYQDFRTFVEKSSDKDFQRTLIFTNLKYSTRYFARARSNVSSFGNPSSFTTRAEVFVKIIERADALTNPVILNISVSPVPDATNYVVELNTKSDFSGASILSSSIVSAQMSFLFKGLRYATTYYARAKSNVSTKFGPVTKFTTRTRVIQQRLWGLTTAGGSLGNGTVFSYSIDSSTFRHHLNYIETSDYPYAYLDGSMIHAADGGFLASSECDRLGTCANGELLHISPLGEVTRLSQPYIHKGGIMLASNNMVYAVDDWINLFQGGIVRLPSTPSVFELNNIVFRIANESQGQNPHAPLVEHPNGYLYGLAPFGGAVNTGVMFRVKADGSAFKVLFHFNSTMHGGVPQGSLLLASDGYFYGTTSTGGKYKHGTIFRVRADGTGFLKLVDFTGVNGSTPMADLVEHGGKLFGFTRGGGDHGKGVLFSVNIDGTSFRKLLNFNGANGRFPENTPTIAGGFIYSATTYGGSSDLGVLFRVKLDGSGFRKLMEFNGNNGANPTGALLLAEDMFPQQNSDALELTGMEEGREAATGDDLSVYPNPFVTEFTATLASTDPAPVKILITNMYGETMTEIETTSNSSPVLGNDLKKGIYILKVVRGENVSSYRVVKK